jgi:PAS domain S-box-containing protein
VIAGRVASPLLVFMPLGQAAEEAAALLTRDGIACRICPDFNTLCAAIDETAGGVLMADDALAGLDLGILTRRLEAQPAWSDLPFVVLTRTGPTYRRALGELRLPELLGNVVFLERPLTALSLFSAAQSALRARLRQWELRDRIVAEVVAAAQLRSEARFRSMADSVPALIRMSDPSGQVIFANRYHEHVFGRTADAILRDGWANLVLAEDRELYQTSFLAAFNARETFATEARVSDKSGRTLWIQWEGVPRLEDSGQFQGYTTCGVDVTEARAAADELKRLTRELIVARDAAEHANHAKSRFLAGMSHELRTPLSGILGYAQLLQMEGGLNPTQTARVDAMMGAGRHLLHMIASVLDLAKIESEYEELHLVELDVQQLAMSCLDLIRPAAAAKHLELSFIIDPNTRPGMLTDPTRLRQVLLNLLGNAVKFTVRGIIELRLLSASDSRALRFEVIDTGPGVPADQRTKLFQEFERLDSVGTSAIEGAGLGLSLSARLATLMGWRIGHDDNPGGGSVFWLELPLNAAAEHRPPMAAPVAEVPDAAPLRAKATQSALHVLVVDDVAMNRDIAASFLRAAGQVVDTVEGGAEAVAAVAGRDFDVVLMDVRMPVVDGLEATRRIRALGGARARVPIVALTAQAFTEQVAECREAGMDDHLVKPFTPATLLAATVHAAGAGRNNGAFPFSGPRPPAFSAIAGDPQRAV